MNWCFAIINNKLAELLFERNGEDIEFIGHAYVKESEYTTLKEKKWIKEETKRVRFTYRKGKYIKKAME